MPGGGLDETGPDPTVRVVTVSSGGAEMIRRKARLLYTALWISITVVAAGIIGLDTASGVTPPTIAANPTTITAGTSTTVTWDKIASPTVKDWIGLYRTGTDADTAFLAWKYTDSVFGISVSEPFLVPLALPPGKQYTYGVVSIMCFAAVWDRRVNNIINAPSFVM